MPIGRDDDIGSVVERVRRAPLVTITGSGGIGKTTVAVAVGSDVCNVVRSFPRGGALGAAIALFSTYPANDKRVALWASPRNLIVASARKIES